MQYLVAFLGAGAIFSGAAAVLLACTDPTQAAVFMSGGVASMAAATGAWMWWATPARQT